MNIYKLVTVLGFFCLVLAIDLIADTLTKNERITVTQLLRELKGIKLSDSSEQERTEEILKQLEDLSDKEPKLRKIVIIWSKLLARAKSQYNVESIKETVEEENKPEEESEPEEEEHQL